MRDHARRVLDNGFRQQENGWITSFAELEVSATLCTLSMQSKDDLSRFIHRPCSTFVGQKSLMRRLTADSEQRSCV